MLIKIVFITLICLGIILLLKVLIRTVPELFDRDNLNIIRRVNAHKLGYMESSVKQMFIMQIISLGVPILIPSMIKREQVKVLEKEIKRTEKTFKKNPPDNLQHLPTVEKLVENKILEWNESVRSGEFHYSYMLKQLKHINEISDKFKEKLREADNLFVHNYQLIAELSKKKDDPELTDALTNMVKILDAYKNNHYDFTDFPSINTLIEELTQINNLLTQTITEQNSEPGYDFYDVLGVAGDASQDEIKSAYRKMAIKFHPDRKTAELNKLVDEDIKQEVEKLFNDKLKKINEAYETLSDPAKRAAYDQTAKQRRT